MTHSPEVQLDCFVKHGFLSVDERNELMELSLSKPKSKIIKDWRPIPSLEMSIWEKRSTAYNHEYFKDSYFRLTNRTPFWLVEQLSADQIATIKQEQQALINCLRQSQLISDSSYHKINSLIAKGTFYKIWEILNAAAALTQQEEFYASSKGAGELLKWKELGMVTDAQIERIQTDFRQQKINQAIDLFEKHGIGHTAYLDEDAVNEKDRIIRLLNFYLPQLPFYQEHTIHGVDFHLDIPHPIHPNNHYKSCVVHLSFNDHSTYYPIEINTSPDRLHPRYRFFLAVKIIDFLCDLHESSHSPIIVVNTFLNNHDWQTNFESFTLLLPLKHSAYKLNKDFLGHILPNWYQHMPLERKLDFADQLFDILDPDRFIERKQAEIRQHLTYSDIRHTDRIASYVQNFVTIIWKDSISSSYTYKTVFDQLIQISNGHLNITAIQEAVDGDTTTLSIEIEDKVYSQELYNRRMDYDFVQLLIQIQTEIELGGRFYVYWDSNIEDGFTFVFLSHREHNNLEQAPIFRINDIDTVSNIWLQKDQL